MATEELDTDIEIVAEKPAPAPSTSTESRLLPARKKPGPHNPDQAAQFIEETTKSLDHFMTKVHAYKPYAI